MKNYIIYKFSHFEARDIFSAAHLKKGVVIFFMWALPSFLFVLWANKYHSTADFYQSAITEGIGPNLWNVIGSFGLFSFGVAVTFSKFYLPSLVAQQVLSNTYAIGCLTFGLLCGQWTLLITDENILWWQKGLFGITSGFLLAIVFLYNLALWQLCFLIRDKEDKSTFLIKLEEMHGLWRASIGMSITLLSIIFFLSEN